MQPLKAATIRQVHTILSGAFAAARRWEWVDGNTADSARPPTATAAKQLATPPADLAKVIAEGRRQNSRRSRFTWGSRRSPAPGAVSSAAAHVLACPGRQARLGRKVSSHTWQPSRAAPKG
jgi:hypothetical protein